MWQLAAQKLKLAATGVIWLKTGRSLNGAFSVLPQLKHILELHHHPHTQLSARASEQRLDLEAGQRGGATE